MCFFRFRWIEFAVLNAAACTHILKITGSENGPVAEAVAMFEFTFDDIGEDLHVRVGVSRESSTGLNGIVIHYPQGFETHMVGIEIAGERKGKSRIKPAVIGVAALVRRAFGCCRDCFRCHEGRFEPFIRVIQYLVFGSVCVLVIPRMELRHLKYFVMAAEEANISRAASRLNVSQPAVSRQIKDLEDELGVELFERLPNGLKLTDAGESALAHARELLRQASAMIESMHAFARRDQSVSLKIGFLPTALSGFLAEGLRKFYKTHQHVSVQIFEMTPSAQEEALRDGEIDLALIGSACPVLRRDFVVETIRTTEMAMVVPDDHRFANRKSLDLAELGEDTFLTLHEDNFPGRPEMMANMFSRAEISPEVTIRARGLTELLGLVGAGAGIAVVPADLEDLPHAGVAFIKLKRPKMKLQFSAAWRKNSGIPEIDDLVELMQ